MTALSPADARWDLILTGLFPGTTKAGETRDCTIHAEHGDGVWLRAIATAPTWNGAQHSVVCRTADYEDGRIRATCRIRLHPDAWQPRDRLPQEVEVQLEAACDHQGQLSGRFEAEHAGRRVTGAVAGRIGMRTADYDKQDLVRLTVQPFGDGGPRQDRAYHICEVEVCQGRVVAARIGPTFHQQAPRLLPIDCHSSLWDSGTCRFAGRVRAAGIDDDPSRAGFCELELEAVRVAQAVVGRLTVHDEAGDEILSGAAYGFAMPDSVALALPGGCWRGHRDERPWFLPVADWTPPQPDEHPRLLFRAADVPGLRRRAATPDGQRIVARLRHVLGGGEGPPTVFNPHPVVGKGAKGGDLPVGAFTCWHSVGYAMLYLLSGEQRHADWALACVDHTIAGRPDRDERYCWTGAGGLRIGAVLEGVVLAYDCCAEAWSAADRQRIRDAVLGYRDGDPPKTLESLLTANGYPPGSNHYGAYIGGPGLAALCFHGDSGVDQAHIDRLLAATHRGIVRTLQFGFGDYGAFAEGHHPARLAANSAFLPMLQAMRSVLGRDYITARDEAAGITLRWIHELTADRDRPSFQHRGVYGSDEFDSGGISHGGEFAHGFGTIPARFRPALRWVWEQVVEPHEHVPDKDRWVPAGQSSMNVWIYPHRALYALVNWPIDEPARNPAELLPRAVIDRQHGYLICRERWQDGDDIIVSLALSTGPRGYYRLNQGTAALRVWGRSVRLDVPLAVGEAVVTGFRRSPDGSALISWTDTDEELHLAIDLSGRSGVPLLILLAGGAGRSDPVDEEGPRGHCRMGRGKVGEVVVTSLTLAAGRPPVPELTAAGARLGGEFWSLGPDGWSHPAFVAASEVVSA